MTKTIGRLAALALLAVAGSAAAQEGNAIGNPQLRDFQLPGERRVAAPPPPAPVVAPPPPATAQPRTPGREPPPRAAAPAQRAPAPAAERPAPTTAPGPAPTTILPPAPEPVVPAPVAPPAAEPGAGFPWLYPAIAAGALALLGLALLLRRRRRRAEAIAEPEALAPAPPPPAPRPDPVPRPWLELALKAERASATLDETVVQFELEIANAGKSAARNVRIDVKMFNAGAEQDKEIGAFFRTAGKETARLNLPAVAAGLVGVIRGEVTMKRDDMRAVVLDDKYLFVPMIAVNALYDWGEGRTGQTSRSYVVGRELQQPSEKMGAFRVDQGPRVWRTIGQRPHTLARRV